MKRLTKAQAAAARRKAQRPLEAKYDADARAAARAIDGAAMKARGETPPWEEDEGDEG